MIHKRVIFKGEVYWLHGPVYTDAFNLSPLDHYDDVGELTADPLRDISYAVIEGESIMRYGDEIGKKSELVDFCGFCQGECKGNHYVSQSSEGY